MFEVSGDINVFSLEKDLIIVNLGKIGVISLNGELYKNLYAICRLLSIDELNRMNGINDDTPYVHDSVELSVVNNSLIDFIGLRKEDVDYDKSDAGLIPRIANAVIMKSVGIVKEPMVKILKYENEISFMETAGAIVSRFMSIPYTDVKRLPVNVLMRYFSICKTAFPSEVKLNQGDMK